MALSWAPANVPAATRAGRVIGPDGDVHLVEKDRAALEGLHVWTNGTTRTIDTESIAISIPVPCTADVKAQRL
jgi:hypothetical protein